MSTCLVVLAALALGNQLLAILILRWNFHHTPDLDAEAPVLDGPPLLVIVPARNEAANIGECVEALGASFYKQIRIRVVDDGSTDETAAIVRAVAARDPRVEVVAAGELPAGWLGKNHAVWVGAEGAREEYLLFVDADVRVGPECLGRVIGAAERGRADLVTVMPRILAFGFWELAAQTLVAQLILGWLPAAQINDPRHARAQGIGPFMLFRQRAYRAIGGHEAVRAEVVEDLRIAERLKHAGHRLIYLRGVNQLSVRMYDSLGGLVRGYTKNFHEPFKRALWSVPLVAAYELVMFAGPYVLPPLALAAGAHTAAWLAFGALAAHLAGRLDAWLTWRLTPRHPYLAPLGAAVVAYILVAAARRRPVSWKGRPVG